ncbi:MAG: cytochrome c [Nitrospirae bacterium]|nr:cytochrome c [Nitrospirota bacterium]
MCFIKTIFSVIFILLPAAGMSLSVSGSDTVISHDRPGRYGERFALQRTEKPIETIKRGIKSAPESTERGKNLFDAKCRFCHNAYSTDTIVGPGLMGILKNPKLPVSKLPATPENIKKQLRKPFSTMPSFDYLSGKEVEDIIAYLNTL